MILPDFIDLPTIVVDTFSTWKTCMFITVVPPCHCWLWTSRNNAAYLSAYVKSTCYSVHILQQNNWGKQKLMQADTCLLRLQPSFMFCSSIGQYKTDQTLLSYTLFYTTNVMHPKLFSRKCYCSADILYLLLECLFSKYFKR